MRKLLSILLPIAGIVFAIYWVMISAQRPTPAKPLNPPAQNTFLKTIAGAGIIEAASRNINLAPPIPGQVTQIFVKENDFVKQGANLYRIDDRELRAKLATAEANIERARANIETVQTEIGNSEAAQQSAQANISVLKAQLQDTQQILDRNAQLVKSGDLSTRIYDSSVAARDAAKARVEQAEAQLAQTAAQLRSVKARLLQAEADLKVLQAQRQELMVNLDRLEVKAPQDGRVLQINIRLGEFVSSTPTTPPMLFGETDYLQVRVDVDEINASRVKPGLPAEAQLKGDTAKKIALEFVRIEPYITPKKSLTGDNTERVDVRVLQVIYRFRSPEFPVYVGQQVDVFIDASK